MRLIAVVVAAAVVTAAAAPVAGAQSDDPLAAVNEVLDRREQALATGDLAAWMATVDPEASAELQAAERQAFEGWRAVPVGRFSLEARTDDTGDLADGMEDELLARYGADEVFLPETRRLHRLEGVDDRDALEHLWLTYVRRGPSWFVGGVDDLRPLGLDTSVTLWELGPVQVQRTEHFLVVSPPDVAARAAQIAETAEQAHAAFSARWDRPWSGTLPIMIPSSVPDLERILQTTFDLTNFVAFVSFDAIRDEGYEPTAPRMYIQDTNLSRHTPQFQLDTLVHELVHAAASGSAGPMVEAWVHEGVAEWVTDRQPLGTGAPGGSDGSLPEDHEFTTGGSRAIIRSYDEATSAMAFLARQAGVDAPVRFFTELGSRRVAPGDADHHAGAALEAVAGLDLAAFQAAWAG